MFKKKKTISIDGDVVNCYLYNPQSKTYISKKICPLFGRVPKKKLLKYPRSQKNDSILHD